MLSSCGSLLWPSAPSGSVSKRDVVVCSKRMEDDMKAMRQCLVIMVLANATTLAGCASNPTDHPSPRAQDVDTARVARIDSIARHHGIEVYWVNYPLKSQQ